MIQTLNIHNTNESDILKKLIKLYIDKSKYYIKLLSICLKLKNICCIDCLKKKKIPRKGFCNQYNIKYAFHGIGCYIETSDIIIDIDFGTNCEVGGFDVWKLWNFVIDNNLDKQYDIFKDKDKLQSVLSSLISIDKQDGLYFLINKNNK